MWFMNIQCKYFLASLPACPAAAGRRQTVTFYDSITFILKNAVIPGNHNQNPNKTNIAWFCH